MSNVNEVATNRFMKVCVTYVGSFLGFRKISPRKTHPPGKPPSSFACQLPYMLTVKIVCS